MTARVCRGAIYVRFQITAMLSRTTLHNLLTVTQIRHDHKGQPGQICRIVVSGPGLGSAKGRFQNFFNTWLGTRWTGNSRKLWECNSLAILSAKARKTIESGKSSRSLPL